MVSAWDVYWVMQLDQIAVALVIACVLAGFATTVFTIGVFESRPKYYHREPEEKEAALAASAKYARYARMAGFAFCVFGVTATALPSSRTAAAMILVPKLTSPEVMQPVGAEAKELYGLAKQALRKLAADEPQKSK